MAILEALRGKEETQNEPDELIRLRADFGAGGEFGARELVVTRDSVRVVEPGGALAFQMPLVEIETARNEPLVGGGRLEITAKGGDILPVVTYSQTVAAQFSEAARGIEQLAKGEPFSINLKVERTRCAHCNRLLPEKDGICPACVNRSKTLWRIAAYMKPYKTAGGGAGPDRCTHNRDEPRAGPHPAQLDQHGADGASHPAPPVPDDGASGWGSWSSASGRRFSRGD